MIKRSFNDHDIKMLICTNGLDEVMKMAETDKARQHIKSLFDEIMANPGILYTLKMDHIMELMLQLHQNDYQISSQVEPTVDYPDLDLLYVLSRIANKIGTLENYLRMNPSQRAEIMAEYERLNSEYEQQAKNDRRILEDQWAETLSRMCTEWISMNEVGDIDEEDVYSDADLMPRFLQWVKKYKMPKMVERHISLKESGYYEDRYSRVWCRYNNTHTKERCYITGEIFDMNIGLAFFWDGDYSKPVNYDAALMYGFTMNRDAFIEISGSIEFLHNLKSQL